MTADALSQTFAALSDPTRRAILARLATGEGTPTDLAVPFDMSLPAVTKHLKVLERAGLITRRRAARFRPCRLEPAPLRGASDWIEQYRRLWEERLDRLETYLREVQAEAEREATAQSEEGREGKATTIGGKEPRHARRKP